MRENNLIKEKRCIFCGSNELKLIVLKNRLCSKCKNCGYVFLNPKPKFVDIKKLYSEKEHYSSWIDDEIARQLMWERRLKKINKFKKEGSLLDIGTGIGQFLYCARPYFNELFGTEISKTGIKVSKEKYKLKNIFYGEIEKINFGKKKFDNITLFHVLEHVENPSSTIRQCYSLLKKKGVLFIAVPNELHTLEGLFNFLFSQNYQKNNNEDYLKSLDKDFGEIHLSFFNIKTLKKLLKKNKFKIVDMSLDPYYPSRGLKLFFHNIFYFMNSLFFTTTKINLYKTIWIVAIKK